MTDFPRQVQVNHHLWASTQQVLNRQSRLNLLRGILRVDSIDITVIGERERERERERDIAIQSTTTTHSLPGSVKQSSSAMVFEVVPTRLSHQPVLVTVTLTFDHSAADDRPT